MAELPHDTRKDAEKEKNTATLSKISNAIKGSEKLDVEGTDLLELLSHLEGELQARDVAIAALKSEQIKRVLYGCYTGCARPASPTTALQRDTATKQEANTIEEEVKSANCVAEAQISALRHLVEKQNVAAQKMAACLRESDKQKRKLVEELEEERAKHERDTEQGDNITIALEKDRIRLREDLEKETEEKQKLEVSLKENLNTLEEEKSKQKQIVLVLLADRKKLMKLYLEEKKRSEDLAGMLQDEKTKMDTMAAGLEEESKRSLAMEAELEKHISQFGVERQQLREKMVSDERRYRELEDALRKARVDVEHFKAQLAEAHRVAMSQVVPPPPYPGQSSGAIPLSASPTPRPPAPAPQPSQYSSYTAPALPAGSPAQVRPPGVAAGSNGVAPFQRAGPAGRPGAGAGPTQQPHPSKFHSTAYTTNSTPGGFGHSSHPALIPAGVATTTISHMDQESAAAPDLTTTYSQLVGGKVGAGGNNSSKPPGQSPAAAAGARKPLIESAASTNRKPALGKGVPPPVPPNKPAVPVKKELGGQAGGGVVAGLQGLKFGISLANSSTEPGKASHSSVPVTAVPAKKFFNNIESKS